MILNSNFLTEEEFYDRLRTETLDDQKFQTISESIAGILGFAGLALLGGFGGALISKMRENRKGKVKGFFKRIFGKKKQFDFDAIKNRSVVKREENKAKAAEERLPEVFKAIKMGDWDEAEMLFKKSNYTDNPEMIKAVALAISDKIGEPPLYIYPSGNETYFICKQILGMKYAKALTQSVMVALKQNKNYYKDIEVD